ncbi:MAG: tripartite tricarboxylate transporter substrate-binding protein [Beijerinckiaceae bacterium]|nr:tripartite tricarboxylate transporter substrate-binding protein [Beijerinckiaceae bacterium]MCZ8300180.1 tripartite tricarboxylate transporter substrate-binding protein [Beijerinckiaceae bacterium]
MKRRDFLTALGAAGGMAAFHGLPAAQAQAAWPDKSKTIKVIVPWPPGAANDALGRLVSQRLQETMGATSITENKVGGAGLIGTNEVIRAEPDGYTFLASAFNTAVMPKVLKAATFDPEVDLEAISRTAVAPLVLVMSKQRPENTLAELLKSAREKPGEFSFAISSLGSAGHLATVDFLRRAGLNINLVPYRGTVPALQDLMSGAVQLLIDPSFALLPQAKGGTIKALGIASRTRSVLAPEVPTISEGGVPDFVFNSWYGVWAPKGTPRAIQEKVNAMIQATMKDPGTAEKLRATLIEPVAESIDETRAFIKSEVARAGELLKLINYQPS